MGVTILKTQSPTGKYRLESQIERRFCVLLKTRWPKAKTRKLNGYGFNSWPDRLVILPNGVLVFIEFKRPGGELTPAQRFECNALLQLGHRVVVCDDPEQAMVFCESALKNSYVKA